MGYGTPSPILIATICITILTVMLDRWAFWTKTLAVMFPWLPDEYHWTAEYALVFTGAMVLCWRLQFNYFAAFDHPGITMWDGYVVTSLVMSGGVASLTGIWAVIEKIPGPLKGVMSTVGSLFGNTTQSTEIAQEPLDDSGEGSIK